MPFDPERMTRISVDLTRDEYQRLRDLASHKGQTHAEFVRRALRNAARKIMSQQNPPEKIK